MDIRPEENNNKPNSNSKGQMELETFGKGYV